jgi:hypothetical protein
VENHEWTPNELRQFADTRRDSYVLWKRLEQEHPDWSYQRLADEFFNAAKQLPYIKPAVRRGKE